MEDKNFRLACELTKFFGFAFWAAVALLLNLIDPLAVPGAILAAFFFKNEIMQFIVWFMGPCGALAEAIVSVLFGWTHGDKR